MKKLGLATFLSLGLLVATATPTFANGDSVDFNGHLKKNGYLNEVIYVERPISELSNLVQETTIKGIKVESDLKINNDQLSGTLYVKDDDGKTVEKYNLSSTESFEEKESRGFNGIVNNGEQFFELFLKDDGNSLINIFQLDENNERVLPFTIHLDGQVNLERSQTISSKPLDTDNVPKENLHFNLLNNNYENMDNTPVSVNKYGIKLDTYTQKGQSNGSNAYWAQVLRTDVDNAKWLADMPYSQITRTNLYEAQIQDAVNGSGSNIGGFKAIDPERAGKTQISFTIRVSSARIPITITTASTNINDVGPFANPMRVYYRWSSKHAVDFETNGLSAMKELNMTSNTPRNSSGQVPIIQNSWLKYEFVGNVREYLTIRADVTNYYK